MNRITWMILPLLSACSGWIGGSMYAERTSDWYETGQVRKSRDEIARTVRELLLRQGYQTAEFDAAQERAETCWDTRISTRWREGTRTKLEAEILPVASGGFNVRIRSTMEINNSEYGNMAEKADWIGAGASEKHKAHIADEAVKIHSTLKLRFFGLNP